MILIEQDKREKKKCAILHILEILSKNKYFYF